MRYFALFGSIMFVLFALLQINDPDPYLWIPAYLLPAGLSLMVFRGSFPKYALPIAALIYLLFSIATFPPSLSQWIKDELNNSSLSMKTPSMEEARESLGSMICFVFLAIYYIYYWITNQKTKTI